MIDVRGNLAILHSFLILAHVDAHNKAIRNFAKQYTYRVHKDKRDMRQRTDAHIAPACFCLHPLPCTFPNRPRTQDPAPHINIMINTHDAQVAARFSFVWLLRLRLRLWL